MASAKQGRQADAFITHPGAGIRTSNVFGWIRWCDVAGHQGDLI